MDNDEQPSVVTQQQPPVSTTLTTSSPSCFLSGKPPFIAITTYECTTSRPIWGLFRLWTDFGGGIEIRDPARKNRKLGPSNTMLDDEWSEDELDRDDTELVRLEPSQQHSTAYTFSVLPKLDGIKSSDTHYLVDGNTYVITLRKRKWRWMFEDEMGEGLIEEDRRKMLKERKLTEWKVDCKVSFEAVKTLDPT